MYKLFLALRYLRAHKIVYFCIAGVALGIMVMTTVTSVMGGFSRDVRDRIRGMQAHIMISTTDSEHFLSEYEGMLEEIRRVPHVVGAAPRLEIGAQVTSSMFPRLSVLVIGIDPEQEKTASDLATYFARGLKKTLDFKGGTSNLPGIVLGSDLFGQLRLAKIVTLWTAVPTTAGVGVRNRDFEIIGSFKTMMNEYDDNVLFMSLEEAQAYLLRPPQPKVNRIAIKLDDPDAHLYETADALKPIIGKWMREKPGRPGVKWVTWRAAKKNLLDAVAVEKNIQIVIMFCIILVAGFNIIAIYDLLVRSKHRDIGIIKALGATTGGIANIYLLSGVLCGLIGSLIGIAGGLLLSYQLNHVADFIEHITKHVSNFSMQAKALHLAGAIACATALCVLKFYYGGRQERPVPLLAKLMLLPVFGAAAAALVYAAWIVLGALPWESIRQPARYAFAGLGGLATLIAVAATFRRRWDALAQAFDVACLAAGIGLLLLLANSLLAEVSDPRYAAILRNSFYGVAALYLFVCAFWFWRWISEGRAPVESVGALMAPGVVAYWALVFACGVAAIVYGCFIIFNPAPGYSIEIFPKKIYGLERIPSIVDYGAVTFIVVATLVASLAASIYPAVRAARRSPVDSIRYE